MSDLFAVEAIEVVREGRFTWQVVTRMTGGMGTEPNMPFWFRWRAERSAHLQALQEWGDQSEPEVVLRLTPDHY